MADAGTRSKVIMGNFFTRIRERSFALALTVAAVLTFGALSAAPATAVEEVPDIALATVAESLQISGTVTGETPDGPVPVAGARVHASMSGNNDPQSATTDIDGHYVLTGLTSGIHSVMVFSPESGYGFSGAEPEDGFGFLNSEYAGVNLVAADETLNVVLKQGSIISGVVSKNIAGVITPAGGIDITVKTADGINGDMTTGYSVDWARTASDGSYSVNSLTAGNYKVSFGVYGSPTGLTPVFYENASEFSSATVIELAAAAKASSISATLVADGSPTPITGVPAIAGEARVGQTLTATGAWVPFDAELSYQWYRSDGSTVVGTSSTYTLTEDDVASTLRVYVTGSATGFLTKSFGSSSTETVLPAETTSPSPSPTPSATPTPTPTAEPATVTKTPVSVVGPPSDRVTMPAETLVVGASIPITGVGFKPFEVVDIWMHSTPVLLGTLTADAQGRISGTFAMPAGVAAGTHHIVLIDEAGVPYPSVALVVTATAELASTGANLSSGWLALALMVLGGLALTVTARRRTASAPK